MTKEEITEVLDSWENLELLVKEISSNPDYFRLLMEIALESPEKKSWRAAYLADKIHDEFPELLQPYLEKIILKLKTEKNDSKKRHFLKLVSMNQVPEKHYGFLVDYCFNALSSELPPAVRVHAMQILYNISEVEKDLKPELAQVIEQEIEYRSTAGIRSRGKKLLNKLRKEIRE